MILLNNNVCPSVPSDQIQTTISFPWLFPFIGSISAGSSAQCNAKNYCAFAFWSGIAGLLDPNLLDRRTAIVEQFTLDLGVYWKLVGTSFQSTKGWANSVILSSSFVSIFVGISRFVHHPHAIRSSWGRSAGSSRHSHSSFHSFLLGKYLQLALHCLSNTPMESYTRQNHARSHTRLNHGPPRKADTPRGQFIEKNNEIAKNVS